MNNINVDKFSKMLQEVNSEIKNHGVPSKILDEVFKIELEAQFNQDESDRSKKVKKEISKIITNFVKSQNPKV